MKLKYDEYSNKLQSPIIVLTTKNYKKLGVINNIVPTIFCDLINANEISFRVYKEIDGKKCKLWDKINNLKLIWVKELNEYFEINVTPNDDKEEYKDINCTSLCEAELSQILLHDIEINTDADIERDDYFSPTVFYNVDNQKISLLHRIISEKAPHYKIGYVSETLKKIQRSFSFDNTSILDAFNEIQEDIGCLFSYDTTTRTINAYDLYMYCPKCKKRYDTSKSICPECGNKDVILPYGDKTQIFFSTNNIAESLSVEYNIDEYKNCFKLKTGDDLLDASVRMINPNGTDYIYNISELMKEDMSSSLLNKLTDYNNLYNNIIESYTPSFENELKDKYNELVIKYNGNNYANYKYDEDGNRTLQNNSFLSLDNIINYDKFSNLYYDIIDFRNYLESSLLPAIEISETSAINEIKKLNNKSLNPTSISSLSSSTSKNTIENAIKNYAQAFIVGAYKVDVNTISYTYNGVQQNGYNKAVWIGTITLSRYGNEDDTATTSNINITINDDYENFIQQKLSKVLNDDDENVEGTIYNIMNIKYTSEDNEFKDALKYYNLNRLNSFKDSYQACLNVLIELDQASKEADLYETLYSPNYHRLMSINNELSIRISSIGILETLLEDMEIKKSEIKNQLDIKEYLGEDLWLEFCSYRREDVYENQNYISDGLNNSQLINNAKQFYELANTELEKSSKVGVTISGSLINFMSIKEFQPMMTKFDVGIWVNVKVNDKIYTVRLSSYEIDFDNLENCIVTFSDVVQQSKSQTQKILDEAKSITTSYGYVQKQVDNSKESINILKKWREDGLDLTNQMIQESRNQRVIIDKNGILLRTKDDITEQFSYEQMRLVNSTIAITDDNWKTIKLALGKLKYKNPETGEIKTAYGLNSETLIGTLILGEKLGIYSEDRSLTFDHNGLTLNSIQDESGQYKNLFTIKKDGIEQMHIDENGNLVIKNLTAVNGNYSGTVNALNGFIGGFKINNNSLESNITKNIYGTEKDRYFILDNNESYLYFKECNHNEEDPNNPSGKELRLDYNGLSIKTGIYKEDIYSYKQHVSLDGDMLFFENENEYAIYGTSGIDINKNGDKRVVINNSKIEMDGYIKSRVIYTGGKNSANDGKAGGCLHSLGNLYLVHETSPYIYMYRELSTSPTHSIGARQNDFYFNKTVYSDENIIAQNSVFTHGKNSANDGKSGIMLAASGSLHIINEGTPTINMYRELSTSATHAIHARQNDFYFNRPVTVNGTIRINNSTVLGTYNSKGTAGNLIYCANDDRIIIGTSSTDVYGNMDIYSGDFMRFHASSNSTSYKATVLELFREQSENHRTVLRPASNGGAYLGTQTYCWNTVWYSNALTKSDLKEKDVIEDFDFKVKDFIMGLEPIAYHLKSSGSNGKRIHIGLGAQTLAKHIKDLKLGDLSMVQACIIDGENEKSYHGEDIDDKLLSWSINYTELTPYLVLMIKEQQNEINSLKKEIDEIKQMILKQEDK